MLVRREHHDVGLAGDDLRGGGRVADVGAGARRYERTRREAARESSAVASEEDEAVWSGRVTTVGLGVLGEDTVNEEEAGGIAGQ